MLRQVKGVVVVRCCSKQLCTGCCVCPVSWSDGRSETQSRHRCVLTAAVGDQQVTSAAGRGQMSPLAAGGRGGTEGAGSRASTTPSCSLCSPRSLQSLAWGFSSCRNLTGTPKWGVTGHHRDSATMFNSSCWICLTLIYAVAFYSHTNVYHLQLHMVTSSAI